MKIMIWSTQRNWGKIILLCFGVSFGVSPGNWFSQPWFGGTPLYCNKCGQLWHRHFISRM